MQKQSNLFDEAALKSRADDVIAAWDAGHISGHELRMLAALFFEDFADDYLADIHECSVQEMRATMSADKLAPPCLAVPVVRLAANMPLLLAHAAECRMNQLTVVELDDVSEDMFARHGEISKIIHAHCANAEINCNYPLYAMRFYRLVQRVMSVLILAGGDAPAFGAAIAHAQQTARDVWIETQKRVVVTLPASANVDAPIYLPLFDIGEQLLRNTDIVAAWGQGLMTWPELRMLAELLYAENAAFALARAYGSDPDEIHMLWNSDELVDPFLGVPLARFANEIRTIAGFAQEYSQLAHQHWLGKASGEEVDAFHARHNTAVEAIGYAPLACDVVYQDQPRYRTSLNALYPAIWAHAQHEGYDAKHFDAAIAKAQRGDL